MNKDKIIYELQQVTWDKLFIGLNEGECYISYVNISHEAEEDWTPEGYDDNTIHIPLEFLPNLKEGIDKVFNEWKKEE